MDFEVDWGGVLIAVLMTIIICGLIEILSRRKGHGDDDI